MELGINLAGADYNLYPTQAEVNYFVNKGFTTIRVGIAWEILQPKQDGSLDPEVIGKLHDVVSYAASQGVKVILDVHNYGSGYGDLIGSKETPISSFADLWGKLATSFAGDANVVFGLMNEPLVATATEWLPAVNAAIGAIRDAGATTQQILVPGVHWDGAHSWTQTDNATVLGAPGAIIDPSHNFAFEVHQYLDDTSGQNSWVVSETIGVERLTAITNWARATGATLYLGEFGVADNPMALAALNNMLSFMQANGDVWQGAAYWAAGAAWHDYMYSVEPGLGILDEPQMAILQRYSGAKMEATALGDGTSRIDTFIDGRPTPSITDIVDSKGHLLARTLFDEHGNVQRAIHENANGSLELTIYDTPGSRLPSSIETYDANHVMLSDTTYNADGSRGVEFYENGSHNAVRAESYDAAGNMIYTVVNGADGTHTFYNYTNGHLSSTDVYSASWQLSERLSYNASGTLTTRHVIDEAGNNIVQNYDSRGVHLTSSTVYSANWSQISNATYDSDGHLSQVQSVLENGGHRIDYYSAHSDDLARSDVFNASWNLASRSTHNGDGTVTVNTYLNPGQALIATTEIYGADGDLQSRSDYNSSGHLTQVTAFSADGTYSVAKYDGIHDGHPTYVDLFSADNSILQRTHMDASGAVTAIDHVLSNGHHVIDSYQNGSSQPTTTENYDANWNLIDRTSFDSHGNIARVQSDEPNGTHIIANYTPGNEHPATIDTYNSSWGITSRVHVNDDGQVTAIDHVRADGSHQVDAFAAGSTTATTSELYDASWRLLSRTTFDAVGDVSEIQVDNLDGTHTIARFSEGGASSPQYIDTYSASWQIVQRAHVDTSGQVVAIDHVNADGGHTIDQYAAPGSSSTWTSTTVDASWHTISQVTHNGASPMQAVNASSVAAHVEAPLLSQEPDLVAHLDQLWAQHQGASHLLAA
jgi:hypothetical protein